MNEMDFYLESIQQLPAIVERGPAEKENITRTFNEFVDLAHLYESAIEVVKTYLGILDSEFSIKYQRNPIHDIKSRLKSAESIINKLAKKGVPLTPENARKNLLDIAGIRVTCYYISDIYVLAEMLSHRDDFIVIKQKDYIKELFDHLGLTENEHHNFLIEMAKKWYVWLVAVATDQETSNPIMLILSGASEGTGKTFFVKSFRHLTSFSTYFKSALSSAPAILIFDIPERNWYVVDWLSYPALMSALSYLICLMPINMKKAMSRVSKNKAQTDMIAE